MAKIMLTKPTAGKNEDQLEISYIIGGTKHIVTM